MKMTMTMRTVETHRAARFEECVSGTGSGSGSGGRRYPSIIGCQDQGFGVYSGFTVRESTLYPRTTGRGSLSRVASDAQKASATKSRLTLGR